jgi:hypothetical protein
MLIELWEKLRGYDKWTETTATIQSSKLAEEQIGEVYNRYSENEPVYEWESTNTLAWADASGNRHTAEYQVSEDSPLFQLYDGQTVTIRYNPVKPDQFYLRGVSNSHAGTVFNGKILPLLYAMFSRR